MKAYRQPVWVRAVALFLTGLSLQILCHVVMPDRTLTQQVVAQRVGATSGNACADLSAPLAPEEEGYARTAWQYFLNNYQEATGFTNSVGGYPSGSLWDMGNYLMALNAARWLNLIDQKDFDMRLNKFLTTLAGLRLFENTLPHKTYNAATGQLVDYNNKPVERGIGWSALDIGRMLAALHVIRTCHPQYSDWLTGIVKKWHIDQSLRDGELYGAAVLADGKTMPVQEGRLGYEEYAVRGYELWGFKADKARSLQPFKFVDIYGVQIPVDSRDYQSSGANNYVVSESYILDGIEFGLQGDLADYASRVLEAQKRRYDATQQLTAVSEDNLDGAPYFLYNTVYANGASWAAITDENKPYPLFRSISTKAAFGWHYLYPTNDYAKKVFDAVKDLRDPAGGGFYTGLYEATKQPNKALTGNTNGLILEILFFKARGSRSLVNGIPLAPVAVPPVSAVGTQISTCHTPSQPLLAVDRHSAQAAWQYFQTHTQATGLVNDRSDFKGATLWGMGDHLAALHAARLLDIISDEDFDQRVRQLLATLSKLPLFAGELPERGYDPWSLQPVDYGDNPAPYGTGWSAIDVGRLLAALYLLKTCHPAYTASVDQIPLDWSFLRLVQDGALFSAKISRDSNGRSRTHLTQETRLGYEEYAARALQLWGFAVDRAAIGGTYQTTQVEGVAIPIQRGASASYTVSNPFVLYGLEFGFDPQMRSLVQPLLKAQVDRYQRTHLLTAAATTLLDRAPYVVHSTVIGQGELWATMDDEGKPIPDLRMTSTAVAFGFYALFPDEPYIKTLWQAIAVIDNPTQGYPEGLEEKTSKVVPVFSAETNSLILQALLYKATHQPTIFASPALNSPWWQAIVAKTGDRGLPKAAHQTAQLITEPAVTYWGSISQSTASNVRPVQPPVLPLIAVPTPPQSPPTQPKPVIPQAQTPSTVQTLPIPSQILSSSAKPPAQTPKGLHLSGADVTAANYAWTYFEHNWNPQTGLVNAVDRLPWTTLWDQGSALLGIHAARQLGLLPADRFQQRMTILLKTLETLPLPATQLPNKAYSTSTAQMRQLDDTPDPQGTSGWSALDLARFLVGLQVMKTQYPEYGDRIDRIVTRWKLTKLVKDGWLYGGIFTQGKLQVLQEGRLGYEQYAAFGLKLWGIEATNALHNPPTKAVQVDRVTLQVDRRDLKTSGASNYLTSDPYLLWGLELGWDAAVKPQVQKLFQLQAQRSQRTGIVTAVNESALDRPPYFLYYSVYANGQPWLATTVQGKSYPELRFLSTKAAFAWGALMPDNAYAKTLRATVQNLADPKRGYFSGRYENTKLGNNRSIDINTNAIILESLLYHARGDRPLAF